MGDTCAGLLFVGPLVDGPLVVFAVADRPDWLGLCLQNWASSPHVRPCHLHHGLGEGLSMAFGLVGEVEAQDMLSGQEDEAQQRDHGLHPGGMQDEAGG